MAHYLVGYIEAHDWANNHECKVAPCGDLHHPYKSGLCASSGNVTDWGGTVIGKYIVTGKWRMARWSPIGGNFMHSFRVTLTDGSIYTMRGMGVGLAATGKRSK